jgi:carbonic anhydrase/acetyltransferase-like protein (isoleucine patch superfamily)
VILRGIEEHFSDVAAHQRRSRMIVTHEGKRAVVHRTAWVAPDATVCGDVVIGAHSRVLYGARLIAEGGRIEIGEYCIVMENSVVRSTAPHSAKIGDHCLIGPNTHVVGCTIEDEVFVATGAAIFHGARLGTGSEVRINGVVHIKSFLPPGTIVPIAWVAVGNPSKLLPPHRHEEIWAIQEPLNFPKEVYGFDRSEANMIKITQRLSRALGSHMRNQIIQQTSDH